MIHSYVNHQYSTAMWRLADGSPEGSPPLPFLHRDHCEILANAMQFRKALPMRNSEGKFNRNAKRQKSVARDNLSAYVRGLLMQFGFKPNQKPSVAVNQKARTATVAAWHSHWFFGTVLQTDSKWWDEDYHGGLPSGEGGGEKPKDYVQSIMANARQVYMKKIKKAAEVAAPPAPPAPPVQLFLGGEGINISSTNSHVTVSNNTISQPARANHACVLGEVNDGDDGNYDDEEDVESIERELELMRFPCVFMCVVPCLMCHVSCAMCMCMCVCVLMLVLVCVYT